MDPLSAALTAARTDPFCSTILLLRGKTNPAVPVVEMLVSTYDI